MATELPVTFHYEAFAELEKTIPPHTPQTWPLYSLGTRRFLIHRFPFAIVYKDTPAEIHILAVMHIKRKPDYWKIRGS